MSGGITPVGRATNKLSDRGIRAFVAGRRAGKAGTKKLSDGGGLYLTLTPAGTPVWRIKYRLGGDERLYSAGVYPEVTLEAARGQREVVKAQLREGNDPLKARLVSRVAATSASDDTFSAAVEEWLSKRRKEWSGVHYDTSKRALERDVLPSLGRLPVGAITPAMVSPVIEAIAKRGAHDTARKTLWHVICVFRLAQARGLCTENPAIPVREVLTRKKSIGRRAALLDFDGLRDLLRRANVAPLSPSVRIAQRLCAFTAARIGNIVEAQWSEFDLEATDPLWTIPRAKMKARDRHHDHKILLAPSIAAELRTWREATEGVGYLFPSPMGNAHVTRESLEKAYRVTLGMAKKHTLHGWRAAFSTLARDAGFSRDVVELTLDHVHDTDVARAYDRGERLEERRRLMHWWDAELSGREQPARVLSFLVAGGAA